MRMSIFTLLSLLVISAAAEKARFDKYRVHSVLPRNVQQVEALKGLELTNEASTTDDYYNFWTDIGLPNRHVDIMVPPHKRSEFNSFIEENNIEQEIKIENVQQLIDQEESLLRFRSNSMEWKNYHKLEEIYDFLENLAKEYPNIVKPVVGGKTYEGRLIRGIEINFGKNQSKVLMEAGIHAREWIGPASTTWMINEILKGKLDPVFKRFNYLYFPIVNPDGYAYTWTQNRMWRKTRTPYMGNRGVACYGADPNRNWNFHWNEVGSSDDPCSETYAGPSAFSEVETRTLAEYLTSVSSEQKEDIYLAYHSYSQLIMYPWGYTEQPSSNDAIFEKVAKAAADALYKVHKQIFEVGSIATAIYPTSGTSIEWFYNKFNATIAFAYELRDTGKHGFLLPPENIIPCGEEQIASLKAILDEYEKLKN
ncbi:hypothetical protein RUM44_009941 [Polyplax serrata]|uniref:Peptidase M14 domain-containing protein n=1 Tax=Polyplax serrata TaxID=468196 RepID=A0ABR1AU35_POLSC